MVVKEILKSYFQKAIGQTTCARDAASELNPKPQEMVTRLTATIEELKRMSCEVDDYFERNPLR